MALIFHQSFLSFFTDTASSTDKASSTDAASSTDKASNLDNSDLEVYDNTESISGVQRLSRIFSSSPIPLEILAFFTDSESSADAASSTDKKSNLDNFDLEVYDNTESILRQRVIPETPQGATNFSGGIANEIYDVIENQDDKASSSQTSETPQGATNFSGGISNEIYDVIGAQGDQNSSSQASVTPKGAANFSGGISNELYGLIDGQGSQASSISQRDRFSTVDETYDNLPTEDQYQSLAMDKRADQHSSTETLVPSVDSVRRAIRNVHNSESSEDEDHYEYFDDYQDAQPPLQGVVKKVEVVKSDDIPSYLLGGLKKPKVSVVRDNAAPPEYLQMKKMDDSSDSEIDDESHYEPLLDESHYELLPDESHDEPLPLEDVHSDPNTLFQASRSNKNDGSLEKKANDISFFKRVVSLLPRSQSFHSHSRAKTLLKKTEARLTASGEDVVRSSSQQELFKAAQVKPDTKNSESVLLRAKSDYVISKQKRHSSFMGGNQSVLREVRETKSQYNSLERASRFTPTQSAKKSLHSSDLKASNPLIYNSSQRLDELSQEFSKRLSPVRYQVIKKQEEHAKMGSFYHSDRGVSLGASYPSNSQNDLALFPSQPRKSSQPSGSTESTESTPKLEIFKTWDKQGRLSSYPIESQGEFKKEMIEDEARLSFQPFNSSFQGYVIQGEESDSRVFQLIVQKGTGCLVQVNVSKDDEEFVLFCQSDFQPIDLKKEFKMNVNESIQFRCKR